MNLINRALNKIIRGTEWYDRYWGGVTKFWSLRTFDIEIVNLGSNAGKHDFCYDDCDISGMNWAIGSQSLVHDFNILKNYFSYLKEGAFVVITICPFSCMKVNYTTQSNLKYYTFLHPATIIGFDEQERVKALTIKTNPFKTMPGTCIKSTLKEYARRILPRRKPAKCDFHKEARTIVENWWMKQFGITDLDSPLSEKHSQDQADRAKTLHDMVEFCIERGLRPAIVIPPVHPELSQLLSATFRQNYIYTFIRKAETDPAPFLDYMDDTRFQKDEYFQNPYFMNKQGAKAFTNQLINDLTK